MSHSWQQKDRMKIQKTNGKRPLWAVMAAGLLGMLGCSSVGSTASNSPALKQDILASDSYHAATRDFNTKWPYGQESQ